ncbi:hypothetical protein [Bacillus sp. Marseille-Q1617]|uniref:YncE family protein n=1 Tax=Bacillus sp. Marseille-Q1617 TaxID=2736887 RepID=UPI00158962E8
MLVAISKDSKFAYVINNLQDTVSVINRKRQKVIDSIKVGDAPAGIALVQCK